MAEAHDRVKRHAVFLEVLRGPFKRQLKSEADGHVRRGLPAKPESAGEGIATSDIGGPQATDIEVISAVRKRIRVAKVVNPVPVVQNAA